MKTNQDLVLKAINNENYEKLKSIDLEEIELSELKEIKSALDDLWFHDSLFTQRIIDYLEMLNELVTGKIEEIEDSVKPKTLHEIMKELGLNEKEYH